MKKRSKLFSHFVAILHALALAIPLIAFAVVSLQDALPKWLSSQAVQHHGGTNDEFSDDLDYSLDNLQTRTMNQNLFHTLDELNYLNYESSTGQVYRKVEYQTNEVNSVDDLIVGNLYTFYGYNSTDELYWEDIFQNQGSFDLSIYAFEPINYSNYYIDELVLNGTMQYFNKIVLSVNYPSNDFNLIFYTTDVYSDMYLIFEDSTFNFIIKMTNDFKQYLINNYNDNQYDSFDTTLHFFGIADLIKIPSQYELISEGGDISTFDEYMEFYQNANFSTIVSEGTKNNFIFNFDFISLFNQGVVNNGDSIASLLFINFYLNYIINISLIIFLPEVIMVFFDICRKFVYKFTDMGDKY